MNLKQVEPVTRKIGDTTFYITPFPAFRAANLSAELASVLAPLSGVVAAVMSGSKDASGENFNLMDLDVRKVVEGMSGAADLNGDKLESLMKKLLLGGHIRAEVENERGEKDLETLDMDLANELFCGEIQDMYALCVHVIQLNYNGFFKRLSAQSGAGGSRKTQRRML